MELVSAFVRLVGDLFGSLGERAEVIITFLLDIALISVVALARPIAYSMPFIRRIISNDEKYAGHYVQIINDGNERRYSLIRVDYRARLGGYWLRGFQYDVAGHRLIDFDSENVAIRCGITTDYIEFVWRSETVADKERFDGYTQMRPDASEDKERLAGRGFFITFHKVPRRYDLRFIKLTRKRLEEIKVQIPWTEGERSQFVRTLHERLKDLPHLQPIEETGRPLL